LSTYLRRPLGIRLVMARLWWKIAQPQTLGVKVAVVVNRDQILLVKPLGVAQWTFPGGGIKRRESPVEAAIRELQEETAIHLSQSDLHLIGVYFSRRESKSDHIFMFVTNLDVAPSFVADAKEIESIGLFAIDNLPEDVAPSVTRRLGELACRSLSSAW